MATRKIIKCVHEVPYKVCEACSKKTLKEIRKELEESNSEGDVVVDYNEAPIDEAKEVDQDYDIEFEN